jgi:hypothetical protein
MSFWNKLKKGAEVASTVGKVASAVGVPHAGSVSVLLEKVIRNESDPDNLEALREIAFRLDHQDARIAALERQLAAKP